MEVSYIIFYIVVGGFLGALSVTIVAQWKLSEPKKKEPHPDYQTQIDSLRAAHHALIQELNSKGGRISRVDNKDIFDRLENVEKAVQAFTKEPNFVRHEHYHVDLPKGKKPSLGKGVHNLFPETDI